MSLVGETTFRWWWLWDFEDNEEEPSIECKSWEEESILWSMRTPIRKWEIQGRVAGTGKMLLVGQQPLRNKDTVTDPPLLMSSWSFHPTHNLPSPRDGDVFWLQWFFDCGDIYEKSPLPKGWFWEQGYHNGVTLGDRQMKSRSKCLCILISSTVTPLSL